MTITFNEKLEKLFSNANVIDAAGAMVSTSKARINPANPAMLRLAVPPLKAGNYTVRWTAVGHDGHRLTGNILFSVR